MSSIRELLHRVEGARIGVQAVVSRMEAGAHLGDIMHHQRAKMRAQLADAIAHRVRFEVPPNDDPARTDVIVQRAELVVLRRDEIEDLLAHAYTLGRRELLRPLGGVEVQVTEGGQPV